MTIRVFSKVGCKYCDMAKEFLEERCIEYEYIVVEDGTELKQKTGQKTFPFIFDGEKFIGGFRELTEMLEF